MSRDRRTGRRDDPTQRASRWLSWALRHDPSAAGLALDAAGWADAEAVLAAARAAGHRLDAASLAALVAADAKGRYALEGGRIRAVHGHSVPVELGLPAAVPPDRLYHGTVAAALPSIRRRGLSARGRNDVHLSADVASAREVGARRGAPVVITVDAAAMHADGLVLRRAADRVWLTAAVPVRYLDIPVHHDVCGHGGGAPGDGPP